MRTYILEGKNPVRCHDPLQWSTWMASAPTQVAKTAVGETTVSTAFLGIDPGNGTSAPWLFETMVFGGELDKAMERYCTWSEAEAGHKTMVQRVKALASTGEK